MVRKIETLKTETGLTMASFGHAGDGNIHFHIMLDKKVRQDVLKAENAISELFDYTLALGGTISGEHGIGTAKAPYFSREIGPVEIELMKQIKRVFDPKGILNPGKIFV
jgi:glycolate oxidase